MSEFSTVEYTHNNPNADTIVVSFAGHGLKFGGVPRIEFKQFISSNFPHVDALYLVDVNCKCYHYGIKGVSTSVEDTTEYIASIINPYKRKVFIGVSAGGYAAMLFGSLLNVDNVLAFLPQTLLRSPKFKDEYRELLPFLNKQTCYKLIGDKNINNSLHIHDISHCDRVAHLPNVTVIRLQNVSVAHMRSNGMLYDFLKSVI